MKWLSLLVVASGICFNSMAQTDSTVVYYNKEGKSTTADSAFIYTVFKKAGNLWQGKTFYSKTNILQSEGAYADMSSEKPVGSFRNYSNAGVFENIAVYEDGKQREITWFYKNGNKRSHATFDDKGITKEQTGWDEAGNEIKGFIVRQPGRFRGGDDSWRRYLEKKLDRTIPIKESLPAGKYTVIVSFIVLEDGSLSNVKASQYPKDCRACANEAVRVIFDGPKWEPAIQNNIPVKYSLKQGVTFVVADK